MTPEWSQIDSHILATWRYPAHTSEPAVVLTTPVDEMTWVQRTATEKKLKELLALFGHTAVEMEKEEREFARLIARHVVILVSTDKRYTNQMVLHALADEEMTPSDVLHPSMMFRIVGNVDGRSIVPALQAAASWLQPKAWYQRPPRQSSTSISTSCHHCQRRTETILAGMSSASRRRLKTRRTRVNVSPSQ